MCQCVHENLFVSALTSPLTHTREKATKRGNLRSLPLPALARQVRAENLSDLLALKYTRKRNNAARSLLNQGQREDDAGAPSRMLQKDAS